MKTLLLRLHHWLVPPEAGVGFMPYIWLLFFGWFWVQWAFQPPDPTEIVLNALSTLVFLVLYFSAFRRRGTTALLHCLALLALGVAWAPFNVGANVFFVFSAAFVQLVGPPRKSVFWLLVILVTAAVVALLAQSFFFFWAPAIAGAAAVGAANIFFAEQDRHNAALRLSQREVRQLARVAERERIAHDLHDLLGHRLSVIVLKSELARKLFHQDPDRALAEIQAVEGSAREALKEVREAIGGYRQRTLESELEQARLALISADVDLDLDISDKLDLDSQTEAVLALVIREAVTNIIRHARARHCRISLQSNPQSGELVLVIGDDGNTGSMRADGSGIDGMRARIEALGGQMRVDPSASRIQAQLPVQAAS